MTYFRKRLNYALIAFFTFSSFLFSNQLLANKLNNKTEFITRVLVTLQKEAVIKELSKSLDEFNKVYIKEAIAAANKEKKYDYNNMHLKDLNASIIKDYNKALEKGFEQIIKEILLLELMKDL